MTVHTPPGAFRDRRRTPSGRPRVTVALVNNMPDAALRATERQFRYLVRRGTRAQDVEFRVYFLPDVPRGEAGAHHCRTHYRPIDDLYTGTVDTLIVTGCEPRAASLRDEPFWAAFTGLVDWARTNTRSALWSCLAAHAAVLHLDGIERRRFPRKLSGIFASERTGDHRLLDGVPTALRMPHSRYNTLDEAELVAHGYEILTRSDEVGPDVFAKSMPSLFLFLQGHPEYERDSLGREFRRDLDRYYAGAAAAAPVPPANYFDMKDAAQIARLSAEGMPDRMSADADLSTVAALVEAMPEGDWRAPAAQIYRNWLGYVAERLAADAPHTSPADQV